MGRPTCATSRQAQPSIAGTGSRVAVAVHGPSNAAWKRHCWLAANLSKSVFVNPIPRAWEPCASGSKHWSWDVNVGHARAVWPRLPRRSPLHCRPRPRLPAAPTRTLRPRATKSWEGAADASPTQLGPHRNMRTIPETACEPDVCPAERVRWSRHTGRRSRSAKPLGMPNNPTEGAA